MDFSKAFDCVCRMLMWNRLSRLGIRGKFLIALKDLYSDVRFRVRVNCKTSRGYVVTISGVRQGCPLSPVLFGLFIEQLHEFLRLKCPSIAVLVIE